MADEQNTREFEVSVEIQATPEQVWKAISEADEVSKWFAPEVRVEPGVGGHVWASWGPGMEGQTPIEVWEPNKRLRLAEDRHSPYCNPDYKDTVPRHIATDYFIEPVAGGGSTILRVVQSGFGPNAEWDNDIESTSRGWQVFFRVLKHNIEQHWGEPAVNISVNTYCALSPEAAWQRLMSSDGLLASGAPASAGSRYAFQTPGGQTMAGVTHIVGERNFSGTVENLNNALVGILIELHKKGSATYLMLTLYKMTPDQVEAVRSTWQAEMDGILR